MATEEKRYLDLAGLSAFKTKLEAVMDTKDNALKTSLTDGTVKAAEATKATQDGNGAVIADTYETKADASTKLVEAKGYTDTLANKVGAVPEGQTVMGIITNIQENAYDDTNVRGLIQGNTDAIDAMDEAYKAADAGLQAAIEAEEAARIAGDNGLDERLTEVEAFFKLTDGKQLDEALDTLVEIQEYLDGEGAIADQMLLDIAANTQAIEAEVTRATGRENAIESAYKAADEALDAKITTAQNTANTAQQEVDALEGVVATKAAAADLTAAVNRIAANEQAIAGIDNHSHSNKAVLDAITAEIKAGYDDAVSKAHVHANASVLDGITAEKVSAWDTSLASAKSYTDQEVGKIGAIATSDIDALFTA